ALNGRKASRARTRKASHAFRQPQVMQASVPPASATLTRPLPIIMKASPIEWFDEEHALEIDITGPMMPKPIAMWLAAALLIKRGIIKGCRRSFFKAKRRW